VISYAEVLKEDGTLNLETAAWHGKHNDTGEEKHIYQQSIYRLQPGMNEIAPKFSWFCYRYVLIPHCSKVRIVSLSSFFIHMDIRRDGVFECADPLLSRINAVFQQTLLCNMHSGLVMDCPHREKLPYTGDGKLVMEAYRNLIRRILDTTDLNVVLVPHVVWESNDDRKVLTPLFEEFRSTGRVIELDDHNCTELKGFIARCRLFIGARTHSTIAAYSQCVPTLVLGYSVKSRGIARDLFGSEEHYVIPVQGMTDPRALADGFDWLLKNENDIRVHLEKTMPGYKKQAYNALDALKKL
jgi:hypothetical protein